MNKKEQKFFDDLADSWDNLFYKDKQTKRKLDKIVLNFSINKGSKILDLGCGTGIISTRLNKLVGAKGEVIGCDYSSSMLKTARKKTKKINFICADAHKLPFEKGLFDGVVCFCCFPHFEDKLGVLREINRITKTGGYLIISHLLSRREVNQVHKKIKGAVSKHMLPAKKWMIASLQSCGFRICQFLDKKGLYLLRAEKIRIA